jgi:hypothetical protein
MPPRHWQSVATADYEVATKNDDADMLIVRLTDW